MLSLNSLKKIKSLKTKKGRDAEKLFLIEGKRSVEEYLLKSDLVNEVKIWKEKSINTFDFFKLFIPIMIVSGLDVTMEGVHFPFVFFSFLGYILSND